MIETIDDDFYFILVCHATRTSGSGSADAGGSTTRAASANITIRKEAQGLEYVNIF